MLEGHRQRLEMLSREYEDAEELIGMLQMISLGVENEIQAGGVNKGLDDVYKKTLDNVNDRMCRELGLYYEKSFSQRAFSIYTDIRKL